MTPDRYRRVGEIYNAVLELASSDRGAFLEGACGSDEELQREVESLLDRKVLTEEGGSWVVAGSLPAIENELPESVRGMIDRKIAQLSDPDLRLLVAASVQGVEFDSAVLGRSPRDRPGRCRGAAGGAGAGPCVRAAHLRAGAPRPDGSAATRVRTVIAEAIGSFAGACLDGFWSWAHMKSLIVAPGHESFSKRALPGPSRSY